MIGLFYCLFGVPTIVMRIIKPSRLGKLDAFQKRYGKKMGNVIHFIFYSLFPLGIGIFLTITGR